METTGYRQHASLLSRSELIEQNRSSRSAMFNGAWVAIVLAVGVGAWWLERGGHIALSTLIMAYFLYMVFIVTVVGATLFDHISTVRSDCSALQHQIEFYGENIHEKVILQTRRGQESDFDDDMVSVREHR